MIIVPLDSIAGHGKIYFQSVVVRQLPGGFHEGTLYLDDAQYDVRFTDIENPIAKGVPAKFELRQNFPNPFNPVTTIRYSIPKAEKVQLTVYNILGQKVMEVVNKLQAPGQHTVHIQAKNLASGVYVYRLKAGARVQVRKMVVLK